MAWVSDYKYSWYEKCAMHVIRAGGNIPCHIALILDGNRRFASSMDMEKIEGHSKGFEKLSDCLRWCLDIGVREVTAFAFSIENFKRSEEEVNGLLNLARDKFRILLKEIDRLHQHGVRLRVIGNISLLPEDLQELIARAVLDTENNDKLFLNIAFSYTSRDEITQTCEAVMLHGEDILKAGDIDECLLEKCLYTRQSSPPDLLFRTSGESRISDFLMWQLTHTVLYFTKILWPQITVWNFLAGIFAYQRAALRLKALDSFKAPIKQIDETSTDRIEVFLSRLNHSRRNVLLKLSSN